MSESAVDGRGSTVACLTESEAVATGALVLAAGVMTVAWGVDAIGLRIQPLVVLAAAVSSAVIALVGIAHRRGVWLVAFSGPRFAAFAAAVAGFAAYICWLAWPSLLPITEGPDLVHHLSLIHFIQRHHALPRDPALGAYLGEMASYTPGSHLIAALAGEWLRVDALRLVHPIQAVFVGLKAGVIYNTAARVLAGSAPAVAPALAGAMLLLLPHRYLLEPITVFGFYSQVIAETFAVAVLWAMAAWHQQRSRRWLALAGVFGTAVVLSWPVYLPATALAVFIVVLLPWWRGGRHLREAGVDVGTALGPAVAALAIFSARHASSAGILRSGGSVIVPSVEVFGWGFLLLCGAGAIVAVRQASTAAPVLAFAAACALQIAALAVAQTWMRATNLYLVGKTVFLLVNALAIFGALALAYALRLAGAGARREAGDAGDAEPKFRATRDASGSSSPARTFSSASGVLIVTALLLFRGLPVRPLGSPIAEPVYRAGMWAKAHVPPGCVDYLVSHWVAGYWLHLDVLGNPRASERMRTETFEYRPAVSRWILPAGRPFAIVEDLSATPADARRNMDVLYRSGPAAVVRRIEGAAACADEAPR